MVEVEAAPLQRVRRRHLTVDGKPWCQVLSDPKTFGCAEGDQDAAMDKLFALQDEGKRAGVFVICMGSRPTEEAAVQLLRRHGIDAAIVEGGCPDESDRHLAQDVAQ